MQIFIGRKQNNICCKILFTFFWTRRVTRFSCSKKKIRWFWFHLWRRKQEEKVCVSDDLSVLPYVVLGTSTPTNAEEPFAKPSNPPFPSISVTDNRHQSDWCPCFKRKDQFLTLYRRDTKGHQLLFFLVVVVVAGVLICVQLECSCFIAGPQQQSTKIVRTARDNASLTTVGRIRTLDRASSSLLTALEKSKNLNKEQRNTIHNVGNL